jgi:EmrB/QacA subfamily drug resistance transporter
VDKRIVLAATTLAAFLTPFMVSSLNIALPAIGKEYAMTAVTLSWVPTSYILATAALLVPFARVADIVGRKRIYVYGTILFSLASLLSALAPNEAVFLASRVVQGAGAAMMFGTGTAILTAVFPAGERGRAFGINISATYLGLSLGPVIGGVLTQRLGWHSVFAATFVLGVVVAVVFAVRVKGEWREEHAGRFDYLGSAVYALALVLLTWGLSQLPAAVGGVLIGGGLVAFVGFVWWETRVAAPVLNLDLFRHNRVFAFSNLAALINYAATFAVGFLLSLYLQYIKAFTAETAGLILIAQPALMSLCSPFAGRLSDRVESRIVASIGMAFTVVGLLLLTFLSTTTPVVYVVLVLCVHGVGFGLFSSPNTNTIMSSVRKEHYGSASATVATMRMIGQMLSMGLAMLVFAVVMGKVQVTPDNYPAFLTSVRVAFAIFTGLCVAGLLASLARGNLRRGPGR